MRKRRHNPVGTAGHRAEEARIISVVRAMSPARKPVPVVQPTFVELFTPKLVTVLREGYGLRDVQRDAVAGLTVAIVALPRSRQAD